MPVLNSPIIRPNQTPWATDLFAHLISPTPILSGSLIFTTNSALK